MQHRLLRRPSPALHRLAHQPRLLPTPDISCERAGARPAPAPEQALFRKALTERGLPNITDVANEVEGLEAALRESRPGDVIALLVHVEREAVHAWLTPAAASVETQP